MPSARRRTRHNREALNRAINTTPRLWNIRNAADGGVPVIELFGDIGRSKEGDPWWGIEGGAGTFQEFAAELKRLGNVPELIVEIHSYGGDVVVGKAIHDKLIEHPANKTARIYGICASAATYAAMACDTIEIPENSFFLIHNSTGFAYGDAREMERMTATLKVVDQSIAALYARRTGKTVEEMRNLMDQDTWMTGDAAVEIGLADTLLDAVEIEEPDAMPDNFTQRALRNCPDTARAWFDNTSHSPAGNAPDLHTLMNKHFGPLLNAASDVSTPVASGGSSAPAAPAPAAPAPAAPAPAVAAPPANAAPATVAAPVAAPAPAVDAAPVNAAPPAAPDLATTIQNAVAAAVKPLQDEITNLKAMNAAGITPQALGGAAPVAHAVPSGAADSAEPPKTVDFKNASPMQLINLGRKQLANAGKVVPLDAAAV